MLRHTLLPVFCLLGASCAFADIHVWEGANPDNYDLDHDLNTIEIKVAGTYGFRAWNPDTYALQAIGDITIDSSVIGNITVKIAYSAAGDPGATNIEQGTLVHPNGYYYYAYVEGLRIVGDMATLGDFECDEITGDIVIGGTVGPHDFIVAGGTTGDLTIGTDDPNDPNDYETVTGNITMGSHYDGDIKIHGYLDGDLNAGRPKDVFIDGPGTHNGNISILNGQLYMDTLRIGDEACEDDPNDPNDAYDPNVPYATMNGDIYIHHGLFGGQNGRIQIFGDMNGSIEVGDGYHGGYPEEEDCSGSIYIAKTLTDDITIHGNLGHPAYTYRPGMIVIGEDLAPAGAMAPIPKIYVGEDVVGNTTYPDKNPAKIHIRGDMKGLIEVGENLHQGRIYVNGSFLDSVSDPNAPTWSEIAVHGEIDTGGAITIDYAGYDPNNVWEEGAQVLLGANNIITENEPDEYVFRVTECMGDLDNDEDVDGDDWDLYEDTDAAFDNAAPGLLGCRPYHSDGNFDGEWISDPNDPYDPNNDYAYVESATTAGCCFTEAFDLPLCLTDLTWDGKTDLSDLSELLSNYGMTSGATQPDGDLDDDGDVDLSDLAALLGKYGDGCDCPGFGESAMDGGGVTVTVAAYDTGGYSGGGFEGEVEHFVFDLKIEVDDPNSDDWVVTGAVLEADNDATFRLSSTSTTPNQYATFVAAPWTSVPGSATASVAGTYDPPDPSEEFTTTEVNLGWYDNAESNDGPATVMRIVIDVSEVSNADVSAGFGSVYFTTTGPTRPSDIFLADLTAEVSTAESAPAMESLSGEFYVKRDTGP